MAAHHPDYPPASRNLPPRSARDCTAGTSRHLIQRGTGALPHRRRQFSFLSNFLTNSRADIVPFSPSLFAAVSFKSFFGHGGEAAPVWKFLCLQGAGTKMHIHAACMHVHSCWSTQQKKRNPTSLSGTVRTTTLSPLCVKFFAGQQPGKKLLIVARTAAGVSDAYGCHIPFGQKSLAAGHSANFQT